MFLFFLYLKSYLKGFDNVLDLLYWGSPSREGGMKGFLKTCQFATSFENSPSWEAPLRPPGYSPVLLPASVCVYPLSWLRSLSLAVLNADSKRARAFCPLPIPSLQRVPCR